jgi:hypothetical protein
MPPVIAIRGTLFRRRPQDPDSYLLEPRQGADSTSTSRWLLWVEDPRSPVGDTRQAADKATALVTRRELRSGDPVVVTGYRGQIDEQLIIVMTDIVGAAQVPGAEAVAPSAIAQEASAKPPGTTAAPAPAGSPAQPAAPEGKGGGPAPRKTKGPN